MKRVVLMSGLIVATLVTVIPRDTNTGLQSGPPVHAVDPCGRSDAAQ